MLSPRLAPAAPLMLAAALTLALVTQPAQAETFRCTGANGTYYADRPCPLNGSTKLGGFGPPPEPAPPPYTRNQPLPVARAPEHLIYMNAECASLSDGLRTAPSRGLSPSTQAELRTDYSRRCSAEESQARQRWAQDQRREQVSRGEKQMQASAEAQREQAAVQRSFEQCGEMRRIIATKNERLASLTAGEVADLRRFEANYAARCQTRAP